MIKNQLKRILFENDEMSISQLSEETGITYSMVYDFANMRRRSVSFETLEAICKVLNVQPGDILQWEDEADEQ